MTKISDTGIPECPIYFTKIASPAITDGADIRFSPQATTQVDYEVELAVVIGQAGINIRPEEAEEYIFGYTVANDVSARDLQGAHKQWFKGKSLDTFCPMGPWVVTADELAFLAAAEAGIFVSTSAGNSGDTVGVSSVAHNSPWTMTVAASTHNRGVENSLTTGDGTTYDGVGYGGPTGQLPMVLAKDIPAEGATAAEADLCGPGTVDDAGAKGKMVVCTRGEHPFVDKGAEVAASGGAAIVVANAEGGADTLLPIMYSIPGVHLTAEDGAKLEAYVSGETAPTGAIGATEYTKVDAPSMASFSSYGPAMAGGGDFEGAMMLLHTRPEKARPKTPGKPGDDGEKAAP